MRIRGFVLLVALLSCVLESAAVVTCGGFVTASSTLADVMSTKLDYSFVKMHLFTQEGLLKYSTECAPNGYYFIPVYDKGSFYLQIEGPDGWAFQPTQVPFSVSDTEAGCSEDINFKFTGFSLSGQVEGLANPDCAAKGGPAGVKVTLTQGNKATVVATTESDAKGNFQFNNVFPGNYSVSVFHPQWTLDIKEQSAVMDWGNSKLSQTFKVVGYDVSGSITSSGEPVAGVDVFMYSATDKKLSCAKPPAGATLPENIQGFLLCAGHSDAKGSFSFKNIPCGEYSLIPLYKRTFTTFDVRPNKLPIIVKHGSLALGETFQVRGFSVSGRVVDKGGKGIAEASIFVNGVQRTQTNAEGYYQLDQITSGKYSIKAEKAHLLFHELNNLQLSPATAALPEITVTKYHVCGRVNSGEANSSPHAVELVGTSFKLSTKTDANGKYCFEVVPGSYTVSPLRSQTEINNGILLSPPSRVVVIDNKPMLVADFVQARMSLSGRIRCVGTCDAPVTITLTNTARPDDTFTQEIDGGDSFTFKDIFPGEYKISAHQEAWCWEEAEKDVTVEYEDVTDVEFKQSGFILHSALSHAITLNITLVNSDYQKSFALKKGTNRFCLARAGVYRLHPVSCYRFEQDQYMYDTSAPQILELQARDYRLQGQIYVMQINKGDFSQVNTIPIVVRKLSQGNSAYDDDLEMLEATFTTTKKRSVLAAECEALEATLDAEDKALSKCLSAPGAGEVDNDVRVYQYTYWASPGDRFEVTPPITQATAGSSKSQADSLLFYPRAIEISLNRKACPPPPPAFQGRVGLFLKGTVTPSVAGAKIVVEAASSGSASMTVTTEQGGAYSAGPLYDDEEYTVSAWSEGYHFVEEKSGHFRALKLGQISISIEAEGKGLEGVLLSLSGTDNYRNNNETNADGAFVFGGLFPGQYFLRPLLKEYRFDPQSKTIDVKEASNVNEVFVATRIAYSVFGSVRSLNGEPEKHLVVEAIQVLEETEEGKKAIGPRYEETVTDVNGDYRLRGLLPNSKYVISVKPGNTGSAQSQANNKRIERTSPEQTVVVIGKDDFRGVDFVAFRKLTKFDLTGTVTASADWLDTLEVVLATEANPKTVLKTVPVSKALTFFEFPALPEDTYILYARTSLSQRTHNFISPPNRVVLTQHTHVVTEFQANLKAVSQELNNSSMLSLFMGVLVLIIALNKDRAFDLFSRIVEIISAMQSGRRTMTSAEKTTDPVKQKKYGKRANKYKKQPQTNARPALDAESSDSE